jgi:two-component system sensor histidine kinase YesM
MNEHLPILRRILGRAYVAGAGSGALIRHPAGHWPLRFKLSIRGKILLALLMVVLLMSVPYGFLIIPGMEYKAQYDTIIQNITTANSINGYIKPSIDAEMWEIIAGKKPFSQGSQYAVLDDVDQRVAQMTVNTNSEKGRVKLNVIKRTLGTLRGQIDQVGIQIAGHKTFEENLALVEQIRTVTQLIEDAVQEYALFEVNRTEQQYQAMQSGFTGFAFGGVGMLIAAILFSIVATWWITKSIYTPIKKLHDVTTTIARQDLEMLVTTDNTDEIAELGMSFNVMVGKIKELLDAKIKEHENLKKAELRALQAQINPHFLYNTLDAIIWMAEAKKIEQVVELVSVLSRFFRITLSKGKDWITVREEIEHVESYLAIQKVRYRDILDYRIDVPDNLRDSEILKLTLQPLVENALYHGIKNKRNGGTITVRAQQCDDDLLQIQIEDNGIGMTQERLTQLRAVLEGEAGDEVSGESGYGVNNVNQRIKLYYGKAYGLTIESEYTRGACVSVVIPLQRAPGFREALGAG